MSDLGTINIAVLSTQQDDNDAVSRIIRNAGAAAHCSWVSSYDELFALMQQTEPELICIFANRTGIGIEEVVRIRNQFELTIPIIFIGVRFSENAITDALTAGAADAVSLGQEQRLARVAVREVSSYRMRQQLRENDAELKDLRHHFTRLVDESTDPMLYVSEGIIVHTNPAWLELFGHTDPVDVIGNPVMDLFDRESRATFKGALMACADNKWAGHKLPTKVQTSDGGWLFVAASLERATYDDEPCVRIHMDPSKRQDLANKTTDGSRTMTPNADKHPLTGFSQRQSFLQILERTLSAPPAGGIRALAYIKPDNFAEIRDSFGPLTSDAILLEFTEVLKSSMKSNDIYGQFGGDIFVALIARGTDRDIKTWGENLRRLVAKRVFEAGNKPVTLSLTVGLSPITTSGTTLEQHIDRAQQGYLKGRNQGGNRVSTFEEKVAPSPSVHDKVPPKAIKQALMNNTFRLFHQPIGSLNEQGRIMFDLLLRMLDENGDDIMPAEFIPVAERHQLMRNIDRWVISAAIKFCIEEKPDQVFIRLSRDTIKDGSLAKWVKTQLTDAQLPAEKLVFQITEVNADDTLKASKGQTSALRKIGCKIAIEHFGIGDRPLALIEHIPPDYIKIDGSLMEGIADNSAVQGTVKEYVNIARQKNIETIAERIEDADTMAILWQLGIEYMQGFYVQGPESVVLETA
ncbi:MAG: GGDEF domain-containing protein [Gammaproteobacteria bacterium]|nr:GGDEF domain-containing protein [Gammaproteobacteria bacterium]